MKKMMILIVTLLFMLSLSSCTQTETVTSGQETSEPSSTETQTAGETFYRGFRLDNVLHSETEGDIHYNLYVPEGYDGSKPYALFLTLPGYEGLYFQGVGVNLQYENFGFEAQQYNPEMLIVAPQLNDWGETSARQTIALIEYMLSNYNIDESKVYAEGYSGGGETLSLVLGMHPELFAAALVCSTQWDGAYEPVAESQTPVYLVVGENDEYYGSAPLENAYDQIRFIYATQGLSDETIDTLLVLDVKETSYFEEQGVTSQHGMGGSLFAQDEEIMQWLFNH